MELIKRITLTSEPEQKIELPEGSVFLEGSLLPFQKMEVDKVASIACVCSDMRRATHYYITC